MDFYLCNILEMDANCRSVLFVAFFPHLSQIVVNVFENDKTDIPCALTSLICASLCVP